MGNEISRLPEEESLEANNNESASRSQQSSSWGVNQPTKLVGSILILSLVFGLVTLIYSVTSTSELGSQAHNVNSINLTNTNVVDSKDSSTIKSIQIPDYKTYGAKLQECQSLERSSLNIINSGDWPKNFTVLCEKIVVNVTLKLSEQKALENMRSLFERFPRTKKIELDSTQDIIPESSDIADTLVMEEVTTLIIRCNCINIFQRILDRVRFPNLEVLELFDIPVNAITGAWINKTVLAATKLHTLRINGTQTEEVFLFSNEQNNSIKTLVLQIMPSQGLKSSYIDNIRVCQRFKELKELTIVHWFESYAYTSDCNMLPVVNLTIVHPRRGNNIRTMLRKNFWFVGKLHLSIDYPPGCDCSTQEFIDLDEVPCYLTGLSYFEAKSNLCSLYEKRVVFTYTSEKPICKNRRG